MKLCTVARAGTLAVTLTVPALASADAFDGGYAGGAVGLFTNSTVEEENDTGGLNDGEVTAFGIEETFPTRFDVLAGFGRRMDAFYLGVEGSYTLSNSTEGRVFVRTNGDEVDLALDEGSHIGVRAGYFIEDGTMAFVKFASGSRNFEVSGDNFDSEDEDVSGSGYGFGLERRLGPQLTLRVDAMQFDYDTETLNFGFGDWHYDATETTVDVGLAYHF